MKRPVIVEDRVKRPFQFSGYYYSEILKMINEIAKYYVAKSSNEWEKGDIIIFNYPEMEFKKSEIEKIDELVRDGKLIIFTGYYGNEDGVCDIINDVSKNYGIKLLKKYVEDENNCVRIKGKRNKKMVITSKIYGFNKNVRKVLFGYCAPVKVKGESKPFVESEKGEIMAGYYRDYSGGMLAVIGTCTFWDNFSIDKFDNKIFARNLLRNKF